MTDVQPFETQRPRLIALAYRMLGSHADAEDVVQDAWLRWQRSEQADITNAEAYLVRTVSRLCLDQLKSARHRRETYVGPWLPEPLIDVSGMTGHDSTSIASDISFSLMLVLERLSPLERACFLLHDIFDVAFADIAAMLEANEAACRQYATRARKRLKEERPRFPAKAAEAQALAAAFFTAAAMSNVEGLKSMLRDSAILYSDGGGKRRAALHPIQGADAIARMLAGLSAKGKVMGSPAYSFSGINGLPGVLLRFADGGICSIALEISDGQVDGVYMVFNPDKLAGIDSDRVAWMGRG
jgi:RNA polymerase sigma-70 factor (ECF subfamily)